MPNSNYARGRAREYQVMSSLRSQGWVCSRSAMSHGPVDVFAARSGRVLLIQVKSGSARIKKKELGLLRSFARAFNAEAEIWFFKKRGVLVKTRVSQRKTKSKIDIPAAEEAEQTVPQVVPVPTVPFANPLSLSS